MMQPSQRRIITAIPQYQKYIITRFYHRRVLSNAAIQKKRSELFTKESKRQAALITDIEKIEVNYEGQPEDCVLIMNRNLSTPYNCAQHLTQRILERAVLAEVDGQVWDMHRPLEDNCNLSLLHFREPDPYYVNKAFWRSASLMLGSVLESAFKDAFYVELCSFPSPNVRSGSFVYDVDLKIPDWRPTKDELRVLSAEMVKLAAANQRFERLQVDASLALKMFDDNRFKVKQVPSIAAQSPSGNDVVVYRLGNFVDMSRGPMISNTYHLGRISVVAAHPIETDEGTLYRVQGVALPKGIMMNHFSYGLLERRAMNVNPGRTPSLSSLNEIQEQQPQQQQL